MVNITNECSAMNTQQRTRRAIDGCFFFFTTRVAVINREENMKQSDKVDSSLALDDMRIMMSTTIFIGLSLLTATIASVPIPFVRNVTFVAISNATSVTVTHRSCDDCLCAMNSSHLLLNCFPDSSCRYFTSIPHTYTIQSTAGALLYFPQQIFPNASQSSMGNTSSLLQQLNTSTPTYATVNAPRCLVIDDHGYLVTISYSDKSIVRLYAENMTRVNVPASPIFVDPPWSLAHYNGAYYVGFSSYILMLDSTNMSVLQNITNPLMVEQRAMTFLNGGKQMIVTSVGNGRLLFFNRSSSTSYDYSFIGSQITNCSHPHGLFHVNDTFFVLSSWADNKIFTYSNPVNATSWTETLAFDASPTTGSNKGNNVAIDRDGRYWFSMGTYGALILDSQGALLGTIKPPVTSIFDTLILDDYVIYFSDIEANRILRFDPNMNF